MIREKFLCDIKELHDDVDEMGEVVFESFQMAISALIKLDNKIALEVIERDSIINSMETQIEEKALKLVALQQPMAKDLRDIFAITKVVTDLERIGDLAVDLGKISKRLKSKINSVIEGKIIKMRECIEKMFKDALEAYFENDSVMAKSISTMDDDIDRIYIDTLNTLREHAKRYPDNIEEISQLMFVSKFLERIGDHITNICEWTVYSVSGELMDLNK